MHFNSSWDRAMIHSCYHAFDCYSYGDLGPSHWAIPSTVPSRASSLAQTGIVTESRAPDVVKTSTIRAGFRTGRRRSTTR